MTTNDMNNAMDSLFNDLFGSITKPRNCAVHPLDACTIVYQESSKIDEAIDFYEKRLTALKKVREMGFDTLREYMDYKKAEQLIAKHKQKVQEKTVESPQK